MFFRYADICRAVLDNYFDLVRYQADECRPGWRYLSFQPNLWILCFWSSKSDAVLVGWAIGTSSCNARFLPLPWRCIATIPIYRHISPHIAASQPGPARRTAGPCPWQHGPCRGSHSYHRGGVANRRTPLVIAAVVLYCFRSVKPPSLLCSVAHPTRGSVPEQRGGRAGAGLGAQGGDVV
jgi:hypothetical protein